MSSYTVSDRIKCLDGVDYDVVKVSAPTVINIQLLDRRVETNLGGGAGVIFSRAGGTSYGRNNSEHHRDARSRSFPYENRRPRARTNRYPRHRSDRVPLIPLLSRA